MGADKFDGQPKELYLMKQPNQVVITVSLFKDSRKPFVELLSGHNLEYRELVPRSGAVMNASFLVEVLAGSAPWAAALATVVCAFLKNRRSRKVIVTMTDLTVVHCEGLSEKEVQRLLSHARSVTVIETVREELP